MIRGGAGVGKTRMVAEVAELAGLQGAVVASTQCFGDVRAAGACAGRRLAARTRRSRRPAATLDPVWRAEVARLLPDRGNRGREPARARWSDAWQRHRFFEGLARALLAVGRPMLLVLDNMQWCDQETLDFITFCLGLAGDAPAAGGRHRAGRRPAATIRNWRPGPCGCGPPAC